MNVKDMKIAVLGAGTMGRSVAQLFAMNGHPVWLYNRTPENLEKALVLIKSSLTELIFPEISDAKVPPQLVQDMIDSGKLGVRSGEGFYHYDHPETAGGKREVKITRMIQAINQVNEELGGYND